MKEGWSGNKNVYGKVVFLHMYMYVSTKIVINTYWSRSYTCKYVNTENAQYMYMYMFYLGTILGGGYG